MLKKILLGRLPLLILTLLAVSPPALAHVEKGTMADPVAEMEYRILLEFKPADNTTRTLLGMALLRQGKLPAAEKEFRLVLQADSEYFDALDGLGLTLLRQKRSGEAATVLQKAVRIRPDDRMVYLHLARALAQNSRPQEARQALQTGIDLLAHQPPSPTLDQQQQEMQSALQELPGPTGNVKNRKE